MENEKRNFARHNSVMIRVPRDLRNRIEKVGQMIIERDYSDDIQRQHTKNGERVTASEVIRVAIKRAFGESL